MPLVTLLAVLRALCLDHFDARPFLHTTTGRRWRCVVTRRRGPRPSPGLPVGRGATAEGAAQDLLDQLHTRLAAEAFAREAASVALVAADAQRADEALAAEGRFPDVGAAPLTLTADDVLIDHGTGAIDATGTTRRAVA